MWRLGAWVLEFIPLGHFLPVSWARQPENREVMDPLRYLVGSGCVAWRGVAMEGSRRLPRCWVGK